jgi:predicted ATP-grasp superfamily ATP-dependent carboligase
MRTVLLTLGRLPKALDIARSFASLGWRVIVADPFRTHLLAASRSVSKSVRVPAPAVDAQAYLAALSGIVESENVDLVIPISEEIMFVGLLRSRLPAHVQVLAMPPDTLAAAHDKYAFARRTIDMGLTAPRTALASDTEAGEIAAAGDFVLKERHSCGGGGVTFFKRGEAFPRSEHAIVQALARGVEYSSCTLSHEGRARQTAIYRATMTSGTVAVGFERVDNAEIESWIGRFVADAGWTGFISFDFMLDENGVPYGLECNPRLTSGVHFFERNDLARAILDSNAPLRLRPERRLQQFWSCLLEAQRALPNLSRFRQRFVQVLKTRDVTWSAADPMPLLTMPWTAREILQLASRINVSLAVAATSDLGWNAAAANLGRER